MVENKDSILRELGAALKKARKDKNRTRDSLAEQVGISPRHLSAIENGEKRPSIEVLREIIHCLGISADLIFYPDSGLLTKSSSKKSCTKIGKKMRVSKRATRLFSRFLCVFYR